MSGDSALELLRAIRGGIAGLKEDVAGATETSPETIRKVYGKHVPEAQKAAMTALP